jgi:hypothetical protein
MRTRTRVKTVVCFLALSIAPVIHAAVVHSSGTVTVILTYANFGQGDFTFRITNQPAGCNAGYWISPSQPGFKTTVAFVMQARATGETVLVGADNAQLWSGSGDQWCKVDYVGTPY